MTTLYFKGNKIAEEDYYEISEEFKVPFDMAANALNQIKAKGEPLYAQYTGTIREKIKQMAKHISTNPPEDVVEEEIESQTNTINMEETNIVKANPDEIQEVTSSAAIGLIRALADPLHGSFIVNDDGCCEINTENPPEITHAYQVVMNVLKLRELGPVVDDKSAWMLGSIVASLEDYFGEEFSVSQVCEIESQAYNTIAQKVGVYKAFKNKRYNLSYTHHQQVHYTKIDDESKQLILSKAESYDLSSKHVRTLCSIVQKMEDNQTIRNIKSKDQALSLIDAYKENKVKYYYYNDSGFFKKNGLAGEIPEGKLVIDTKNEKAYINGEVIDIQKG
jgi:hypothetical protein